MRTSKVFQYSGCAAGAVGVLIAAWACGANSQGNGFGANGGGGGAGGTGTGGSGATSLLDATPGDGSLDEAGACTGQSYPGKLVPLDIYVLLDATGSMNGSDTSPEAWTGVTNALVQIVSDPLSEGIGMGITYLPVPPQPGFHIPGSCTTNADCPGSTGPCESLIFPMPKLCTHACTTDAQCGLYGPCAQWPFTDKWYCTGAQTRNVSCDATDYGKPVVAIDTLPANQSALLGAINSKSADGDATPTQPSLEGALTYARQWAVDHPSHLVHVLFATDGLPNDCTYDSIDGAAAAAKGAYTGAPSVPTFVLGIGDLGDLNKIAQGGGTNTAYMADGASVASTMVQVFNEIRANGACKFQIPPAPAGQSLNYELVNVYYTPLGSNEKQAVKYVGDVSQCDSVEGGWYYDNAQSPTKILLCPASCEGVKLSSEGVEVLLGCKTVVK